MSDCRFCRLFLVSLFLSYASYSTANTAKTTAELKQLRSNINALQQRLQKAQNKQSSLRNSLRDVELEISKKAGLLNKTQNDLKNSRNKQKKLSRQVDAMSNDVNHHQQQLERLIHNSFISGRQDKLKLLLNQEDPDEVGRMMTYHSYFARQRTHQIQTINLKIQQLQKLQAELQKTTQKQLQLEQQQKYQLSALVNTQDERNSILERINSEISSDTTRLKRLQENEQQLQKLLEELQAIVKKSERQKSLKAFASMRGKMAWPHHGKILHSFGTSRGGGNLHWRGVMIDAKTGDAVKAIYSGQVIFADWLRGFGLIVILDHGSGYMSLYGFNQQISVNTGDLVERGEVIALAGSSGGQSQSGVYFAIRHNSKPQNPRKWCRKQK